MPLPAELATIDILAKPTETDMLAENLLLNERLFDFVDATVNATPPNPLDARLAIGVISRLKREVAKLKSRGKDIVAVDLENRILSVEVAFKDDLDGIVRSLAPTTKDPMLQSDLERSLRSMPDLFEVIKEAETTSPIERSTAMAFREVIADRTRQLIAESPPAAWTQAEKDAFEKLTVEVVEPLFEYGVLQPKCIDGKVIAVKDPDALLNALDITSGGSGAYKFNDLFNKNPLVNSSQIDDEQFHPSMGIIQTICCVMYQLMKKKDSPGDVGDVDAMGNPAGLGFSTFDRTAEYAANQAEALVAHVCRLDSFQFVDESGTLRTLNVKAQIGRYPDGVATIIKYFALLKASRDDLGQKATNYIQLVDGKSAKLGHRGSNDKQWVAGYISRSVYKAAQTANNQEHMIVWAHVSPRYIPGLSWLPTGQPNPADSRASVIYDKMKTMDAYYEFWRSPWERTIRPTLESRPKRWNHDFPALDEFCNAPIENRRTPSSYRDARDAWGAIIAASYKSLTIRLEPETTELRRELERFLSDLFTKVAILTGYIGPGFATPGAPSVSDKYIPYHQLPKSALKMTLLNLIIAVPGEMISPAEDATAYSRIFGGERNNETVLSRREYAIEVIKEQIKNYPSLGSVSVTGTYAQELFAFLSNPDLVFSKYVDAEQRAVTFNAKKIKYSKSLRTRSQKEQDLMMEEPLEMPFDPKRDDTPD